MLIPYALYNAAKNSSMSEDAEKPTHKISELRSALKDANHPRHQEAVALLQAAKEVRSIQSSRPERESNSALER